MNYNATKKLKPNIPILLTIDWQQTTTYPSQVILTIWLPDFLRKETDG